MSRLVRFAALTSIAIASNAFAQTKAPIRPLAYTRFTLPNGLTAILNVDHASPIVAVDMYYKIGSRDDTPGRVGITHFCEHVMGEGSPNLDRPQSDIYRTLGGTSPHAAATTEDVTHYYTVLPSQQLETAIWMEADRLANKFSKADSATMEAVRGVVRQERLQTKESQPVFGAPSFDVTFEQMFPAGFPYHMSGLSPLADLTKITASDLRDACGPSYVPNNAVLGLSGDFDPGIAKKWIEKYFGPIKRGAAVKRAAVPPYTMSEEKRIVLEDARMTVPQFRIIWTGASYDNPDRIPLLALASILSLSRVAQDGHLAFNGVQPPASLGRLSKILIQDRQLATTVVADNNDLQQSGIFHIDVYPRANASLTTIENIVDSVLTSFATNPVTTQELAMFNSYNYTHLETSLEPKFARADTLAHDEIFAGDPAAYAKQATRARSLTPADLERVRKKYLTKGRIVMSLVPAGKTQLASKPELPFVNATPSYAAKARP